jgi:phage tail protein X
MKNKYDLVIASDEDTLYSIVLNHYGTVVGHFEDTKEQNHHLNHKVVLDAGDKVYLPKEIVTVQEVKVSRGMW